MLHLINRKRWLLHLINRGFGVTFKSGVWGGGDWLQPFFITRYFKFGSGGKDDIRFLARLENGFSIYSNNYSPHCRWQVVDIDRAANFPPTTHLHFGGF